MIMNKFVFIIPSFNNEKWCEKNILSILDQDYQNWRIIYINDCSIDNTVFQINYLVDKYHLQNKFTLIHSEYNEGPAASRYKGYTQTEDNEICCFLDGDDWLYSKKALNIINACYEYGYNYTYGSYVRFKNSQIHSHPLPTISIDYPFIRSSSQWRCQHLRTMRSYLIKNIDYKKYLQINDQWIRYGTDMAESIYVLEQKDVFPYMITSPLYVYNIDNSISYDTSYFCNTNIIYKDQIIKHIRHL